MVRDPSSPWCRGRGRIASARAADRNVAATRAPSGASCDTHAADGSAAALPGLSLWALLRRGVLRVVDRSGRPWPVDHAIVTDILERIGPEGCVELAERPFGAGGQPLIGGDDMLTAVTDNTYIGNPAEPEPLLRRGLESLRNEEEISIIACPGRISPAIQGALINHCELTRYRSSLALHSQ